MEATTRIIDLTVAELISIINATIEQHGTAPMPRVEAQQKPAEQPFYGIDGIAEVLHCSRATAQRLKSSGMLEGGYQQIGKSIIVRSAQALRDIAEYSMNGGRKRKTTTLKHK